ncbi:hypothetical protein EDD36DRAFT_433248 [Exophiala viscosa]|uniref:Uncharacterized protein n=1 Tax=Exophiala viscosa TaxID=2486360 RepID=A0AAN6IG02_9EURO|nr:hypothetical protein EDD36DRAFT_433248 [Exophiala viscosa]
MASEKRLRKMSQSRPVRPAGMPKRSSSFRRAYNYLFNAESSAEKPAEKPMPTRKPPDIPRPNASSQSQIEALRKELQQCRLDLYEAREIVVSQDQEIQSHEQTTQKLQAQYKEKEASLRRQKASLEENMVAVVVQQIRDAQKAERDAAKEDCRRQHEIAIEDVHHKYNSRVAILTQELHSSRAGNEQIKTDYENQVTSLEAELASFHNDLEAAKHAIAETTSTLHDVQQMSATALEESREANSAVKAQLEAQLSALAVQLQYAEVTDQEHTQRFADLQESSAKALTTVEQSLISTQQHLQTQIDAQTTELSNARDALDAASKDRDADSSAYKILECEFESARQHIADLNVSLTGYEDTKQALSASEARVIELNERIQELGASEAALKTSEERVAQLMVDLGGFAACKEELARCEVKIAELNNTLDDYESCKTALQRSEAEISELADKVKEYAGLKAELEHEKVVSGNLSKGLAFKSSVLDELRSKHEEAISSLHCLEEKHKALLGESQTLKDQLATESSSHAAVKDRNNELSKQFEEISASRLTAQTALTAEQDKSGEIIKQVHELQKTLNQSTNQSAELEAEKSRLLVSFEATSDAHKTAEDTLADLRERLRDVEDRSSQELDHKEADPKATLSSQTETETRLKELEGRVHASNPAVSESPKINHLNEELKAKNGMIDALTQRKNETEARLKYATEKIEALRTELKTKSSAGKSAKDLEARIQELQQLSTEQTENAAKLQAELDNKVEVIVELTAWKDNLEQEIDSLTRSEYYKGIEDDNEASHGPSVDAGVSKHDYSAEFTSDEAEDEASEGSIEADAAAADEDDRARYESSHQPHRLSAIDECD